MEKSSLDLILSTIVHINKTTNAQLSNKKIVEHQKEIVEYKNSINQIKLSLKKIEEKNYDSKLTRNDLVLIYLELSKMYFILEHLDDLVNDLFIKI